MIAPTQLISVLTASSLLAAAPTVPEPQAQETPSPDSAAADQETPDQETPDQETPDQETPDQETPDQETPDQETPDQETPDQETPSPDPAAQDPAAPPAAPAERSTASTSPRGGTAASPETRSEARDRSKVEFMRRELSGEPVFKGNGLLIGGGLALATVLGSGITLSALRAEEQRGCPELQYPCETNDSYGPAKAISGTLLVGSGAAGIALGVSGGVLRGRYDAWRSTLGDGKTVQPMGYYAGGAALLAAGGILGASAFGLWYDFEINRNVDIALPLMWMATETSLILGTSLIAYAASYAKRRRQIENFVVGVMLDRDTGAAGLRFSGRF